MLMHKVLALVVLTFLVIDQCNNYFNSHSSIRKSTQTIFVFSAFGNPAAATKCPANESLGTCDMLCPVKGNGAVYPCSEKPKCTCFPKNPNEPTLYRHANGKCVDWDDCDK